MFVAKAHSFTQQARLAITLAGIAGYTNILTILTCGTVTSHVSGTTSLMGEYAVQGKWALVGFTAYLIAMFLVGAMVSGFTTELGRRRGYESIYVLPMAIEAILLAVFAAGVQVHGVEEKIESGWLLYVMIGTASAAMGLQNATITRISSGVVRTTHVTGVLTDLGTEIVQAIWWVVDKRHALREGRAREVAESARRHPTAKRLVLLGSIVGSFAGGAAAGTVMHGVAPGIAMFPPVLFLVWVIYQDVHSPIAEIEPSDLVVTHGLNLPASMAVFHLRHDAAHKSKVHSVPDLLAWADRLPDTTRVVIMDLAEAGRLDAGTIPELHALLDRFTREGRRLIIAGLNADQYEQLSRAAWGEMLRHEDLCPDLELAIARGIVLAEDGEARR